MKRIAATILLVLGGTLVALADSGRAVLVLDGECVNLHFAAPDTSGGAFPPGTRLVNGTGLPEAYEVDGGQASEPRGAATSDAEGAAVLVCNVDGDLFGPNRVVQTGLVEGPQIEVEVCFLCEYPVTTTLWPPSSTHGPGLPPFRISRWVSFTFYSSICPVINC